jgi:tRNA (mo5U34)-methyltransferase
MAHWTQQAIRERVRALGPWFHNLDLAGVATAPEHFLGDFPTVKWQGFSHALPDDLHGMSVLDIGCNAGFYSMALKARGAERVVAIDHDPDYLAQARFAAEICGMAIEFRELSVYDVGALRERFDLVMFIGVFYHLRHPLLALDLVHEHVARDLLVFQSMQRGSNEMFDAAPDYDFSDSAMFDEPAWPKMHFIEHAYARDPTNWWAPNAAGSAAMLRAAGFVIDARPEPEVFICHRGARPDGAPGAVYPARGDGTGP